MCVSSKGPGDMDMKKYWHVGCFKLPRKFSSGANKLTVAEFLDQHVTSDAEYKILPEMEKDLINMIEGAGDKLANMKKRDKEDSDTTIMGVIKKAAAEEEGPKKKKRKTDGDDVTDFDGLVKEYRVIANAQPRLSVDALKDYLRYVVWMTLAEIYSSTLTCSSIVNNNNNNAQVEPSSIEGNKRLCDFQGSRRQDQWTTRSLSPRWRQAQAGRRHGDSLLQWAI
jgi:hypothetical protein